MSHQLEQQHFTAWKDEAVQRSLLLILPSTAVMRMYQHTDSQRDDLAQLSGELDKIISEADQSEPLHDASHRSLEYGPAFRANIRMEPSLLDVIMTTLRRRPTILVSSSRHAPNTSTYQTSLITMENVLEFLEKGKLNLSGVPSPGDVMKENGRLILKRVLNGKTQPTKIAIMDIDQVHRLTSNHRQCSSSNCLARQGSTMPSLSTMASGMASCKLVHEYGSYCCIFWGGFGEYERKKMSQFKSNHFKNLRQFYATFQNLPIPSYIREDSSITILRFSRDFRHNDIQINQLFWSTISQHLLQSVQLPNDDNMDLDE